jgi:glutaminyl-tRNA synthetase
VILGRHIMVEKEDVRKEDAKGFFGIAPGKVIRLKYGPAIKITGVTQTHTNLDVKAEVLPEEEAEKLPTIKGVLNWVSKTDSVKAEFRLFTKLFVVPKPVLDANSQEARMKEMDLNSKVVCHNAKINKSMLDKLTPESRFQFERIGFFYLDPESDVANGKIIFNRIIETQNKKKETKED